MHTGNDMEGWTGGCMDSSIDGRMTGLIGGQMFACTQSMLVCTFVDVFLSLCVFMYILYACAHEGMHASKCVRLQA